ncbi:hypothetical protein [Catellatospora sp. TT07R-123]|uniref:hypothetical protein n=1 Tax=Catellatospora sp. TT07R-123 TaxID=2733863 RepID=UPI001BB40984|nr:hypothetical protein [Catellatospora sp. TT07R-123]
MNWTKHPKSWFRDALAFAKKSEWQFQKIKGHGFGQVRCCDPDTIDDDPCEFFIFSTGEGGEGAARGLRQLVANCTHKSGESIGALEALVLKVEKLIEAANAKLDHYEQDQESLSLLARAEELVSDIEEQAATIDYLLSKAVTHSEASNAALAHATELLEGYGLATARIQEVVEEAAETHTMATRAARTLPSAAMVKGLRIRLVDAKAQLATVRRRLTEAKQVVGDLE